MLILIINFLKELTTTVESQEDSQGVYYESSDQEAAQKDLLKVVEEVSSKLRK